MKVGDEYYVRVRVRDIDKDGDVYASTINEKGEAIQMLTTFFANTEAETFIPADELRNAQATTKPAEYGNDYAQEYELCDKLQELEADGWQIVAVTYTGQNYYSIISRKEQQ